MTLLDSVALKTPLNIHGTQVRYITAQTTFIRSSGETSPGWDLYLHPEWVSVAVVQGEDVCLVPLGNVESMVLAPSVSSGVSKVNPSGSAAGGGEGARGPGRPRSKRLGLV